MYAELSELTRALKQVHDVHRALSRLKSNPSVEGDRPTDRFVEVMGEWLSTSGPLVDHIKADLVQTTRAYTACARRLCVDPAEGPEVLFGRLSTFATHWRAASAQNAASSARVARDEWLAVQKQARIRPAFMCSALPVAGS